MRLCLDARAHGTESLAFAEGAPFQGAALLCFNDATFSDADFASISRIGDSVKRDQAGKTGRFGCATLHQLSSAQRVGASCLRCRCRIGFSSVYHITDLPSFVSGRYIAFFDPHCEVRERGCVARPPRLTQSVAQYLPNISAANPGKRIDFVTHAVAAAHADQFSPYKAFGCDMKASFAGTLFRFPLRTAEQAARSRLSKQAHTVESLRALLKAFESEAVRDLLFLRNLECVELLEWLPGTDAPVLR